MSFVSGVGGIKTRAVEQIDEAKEMDEIDLNTPQRIEQRNKLTASKLNEREEHSRSISSHLSHETPLLREAQ